jgi:hypothetical protein
VLLDEAEPFGEVVQIRDVAATVTQRWHLDSIRVETVVEIFPESTSRHFGFEIAGGGSTGPARMADPSADLVPQQARSATSRSP